MVAPAGTSRTIVDKLNVTINKGLALPETVQRFHVNGLEVATSTPHAFHDMIRADLQTGRKLNKDAKISVDSLP